VVRDFLNVGPQVAFEPENREWLMTGAFNVATSLLVAAIALRTLVLALKKRRQAVPWFQGFFSTSLGINVLVHVYDAVVSSGSSEARPPLTSLIWSMTVTLLWLRYFQNDPRVKATFVRD
jgi:hypothetical protein